MNNTYGYYYYRCELHDDQTHSYLDALNSNTSEMTQLVVCLLPSNRKDRYDAIKKFCCVQYLRKLLLTYFGSFAVHFLYA